MVRLNHTCPVCGKVSENPRYSDGICSDECFHKDFWNQALTDPDTIIVNQTVYTIGDEDAGPYLFRGFSGSKFIIKMKATGEVITSTNLWYRGTVKECLKNYPDCPYSTEDTAEFIKE